MGKYRTPEQREAIIWLVAAKDKLLEYVDEWPSAQRNLVRGEIVPALENWATKLMDGISPKEGKAIIDMAARVNPMLIATDFTVTDDTIKVDVDDYYALAELALEYCRFSALVAEASKMTNAKVIKQHLKRSFKCQECRDPENCTARQVFLRFLVPPLAEDGPCQYYRGEGAGV